MKIVAMSIIDNKDIEAFHRAISNVIIEYEKKGLTVEIQYSRTDYFYSALVIGRGLENRCLNIMQLLKQIRFWKTESFCMV